MGDAVRRWNFRFELGAGVLVATLKERAARLGYPADVTTEQLLPLYGEIVFAGTYTASSSDERVRFDVVARAIGGREWAILQPSRFAFDDLAVSFRMADRGFSEVSPGGMRTAESELSLSYDGRRVGFCLHDTGRESRKQVLAEVPALEIIKFFAFIEAGIVPARAVRQDEYTAHYGPLPFAPHLEVSRDMGADESFFTLAGENVRATIEVVSELG